MLLFTVHDLHLQVTWALLAPMQVPREYWPVSTIHVRMAGVKKQKF